MARYLKVLLNPLFISSIRGFHDFPVHGIFQWCRRDKFSPGKNGYRPVAPTNKALFSIFASSLLVRETNVKEGLSFLLCNITVYVYCSDQERCQRTVCRPFTREVLEINHGVCSKNQPGFFIEKVYSVRTGGPPVPSSTWNSSPPIDNPVYYRE